MKFLLQMAGFPGAGKSTLSKRIANETGAIVIDRDIIKNAMLSSGLTGDLLAEASYKVVFGLAGFYLRLGNSVIIDTPCFYKEIVENGVRISSENESEYKYIECIVDDYNLIVDRLRNRESLATQYTEVTEANYRMFYDKSVKPQGHASISVDTRNIANLKMDEILNYLKISDTE